MEYFWSQGVSKLNKKYFFCQYFFIFCSNSIFSEWDNIRSKRLLYCFKLWASGYLIRQLFFLFRKMRSQSTFKNCGAILVRADQISPNFWSPFYFLHFLKFLKNNYSIGQSNAQRLITHKSLFVLALTQLEKIRFENRVFFFLDFLHFFV